MIVPRGERRGHRVRLVAEDRDPIAVGLGYGRDSFEQLCPLPCTLQLEPGMHRLTLTGPSIREYMAVVDARTRDQSLVATTPTRGTFAAGLTLTLVGLAVLITGATVLAYGASTEVIEDTCRSFREGCETGADDTLIAVGAIFGVPGAIMGIGGAVVLGNNSGRLEVRSN